MSTWTATPDGTIPSLFLKDRRHTLVDDNLIIDLYWQRNEQAVAETEAKYGPYCRSIAYGILQNNQDTE